MHIDAIVADELQVVSVVQGTPAATPITPAIGDDQVLVQYVLVGASATTPTITTEYVYREGSAPDWTGGTSASANSPVADFASATPTPFQGSECTSVDYTQYSTGRWVRWTTGSPINRSDYAVISMRVYLEDDLTALDGGAGRRMFCRLYGGGVFCGTVYLQSWGLDLSSTGSWQLVSIPMGAFLNNPGQTTIDEIIENNEDQDFFSAIKVCKKKRIGPARDENNRPLFFKKDIGILARSGFDFETSKRVMDLEKSEYLKIINLL